MSTLSEFAQNEKQPARNSTERWLMSRPALMAEIAQAQQGVKQMTMYRWLKTEHGYPFSKTAFNDWYRQAFSTEES